jgi:hypothetical protein
MAKSTAAIEIEVTPKGGATETVKTFKQQLKEAKNEAQQLVATFGEFSQEALAGQQKVANLADQMDDFNDRVKALNPDKFARVQTVVNGVASGFSAAQGAMALFGSESEDLQKQLVKVQGAMALAQGLEGLGKVQQQFTTLAKDTLQGVIKAFSTLKGAIIATGIGALVVGLGLLITYWDDIKEALGGVSEEQIKVNAATRDAVAAQQGNIEKLKSYQKLVGDTSLSEKERKVALNELNKLGIETRDININSANSLSQLNARITDNINLIKQKAQAQALEKIIAEETEKIYREQNKTVDEQVGFLDQLYAIDIALMTSDYEGAKASRAKQKANENINKSQKLLNAATSEYDKILKGTVKTEAKVIESTTQVNDAYEKQNSTLQNKLNLQLIALDKAKAIELSNLNLTEREKIVIENKYAELSLSAKENAIKKEQALLGAITDPKQRLSQQRKLNEDLAKLDVDRINQKTGFNEKIKADDLKIKAEAEKLVQQQQTDTDAANQILLKSYDEYYAQQILIAKESGKTKEEIEKEVARLEVENLEAKLVSVQDAGDATVEIEAQIFEKKKAIKDKEAADDLEREKNKQEGIYNIANSSLSALSSLNEAFASDSEESQKRAFEIDKALKYASTIMATIEGTQSAFTTANKSPITAIFPAYPYVQAGAALAFGLANLKKISDTKFQSKSTPSAGGNRAAGGGGGMQQMAAPNMSSLGNGNELTQDRRVYVTEGDISRTQKRVSNNQSVSVVE